MGVTSKNISKDFLYYAELGHKTKSVSPKAYSNLLGFRKNVSLINVERIKESLSLSSQFISSVLSKKPCSILFVNLDNESNTSTKVGALRSMQPFLVKDWSSGTLTNIVAEHKIYIIFMLSAKTNNFILQEAKKLSIPVVAVVDTDTNSNLVSFPIWLNDDSIDLHHDLTIFISSIILQANLTNYGLSILDR